MRMYNTKIIINEFSEKTKKKNRCYNVMIKVRNEFKYISVY